MSVPMTGPRRSLNSPRKSDARTTISSRWEASTLTPFGLPQRQHRRNANEIHSLTCPARRRAPAHEHLDALLDVRLAAATATRGLVWGSSCLVDGERAMTSRRDP